MKIGVILLLVAGPFIVRAQLGREQFSREQAPGGLSYWKKKPDSLFLWRPWWADERKPVSLYQRSSIFIDVPHRMPCLILRGMDPMPIDRRRNAEPMPNGMKRVKIEILTRP